MLKSSTMISIDKTVVNFEVITPTPRVFFCMRLCWVPLCLCVYLFYSACLPSVCPILQNDLDDPERGMIFVCSATHKTKSMFFFLAQTEQGDIFKVTLETDEEMVSKPEGSNLF